LGTVARGVIRVLQENAEIIGQRAGRPIVVTEVASRRARPEVDLAGAGFNTDVASLPNHSGIDVLVELIGGEDTALSLIESALRAGKPVVTANKAVLALHGHALQKLAGEQGVSLGCEAAVAGGIPIIGALQRGLAGNEVECVAGIINGTSNYILTAMARSGQSFEAALADAQRLGYAEADPTFDVEGVDAAHKLTILAALAFGMDHRFSEIYIEGISGVTLEDLEYAGQLGYRIKHLGIARRGATGVEIRVHPTLVPESHLLAHVDGVMNAVLVNGNAAGDTLYYGAGAGELPSASAVVADLVDLARGTALPPAASPAVDIPVIPIEQCVSAHYLRIPSLDRPGVFARVATLLSEHGISIESAIQRAQAIHTESKEHWVPIVIVTQPVVEGQAAEAVAAVQALPEVVGQIVRIRVEDLDEH
jgi:homoserine dehydrogenase